MAVIRRFWGQGQRPKDRNQTASQPTKSSRIISIDLNLLGAQTGRRRRRRMQKTQMINIHFDDLNRPYIERDVGQVDKCCGDDDTLIVYAYG